MGYTYNVHGPFTKQKERVQKKNKKTEHCKYDFRSELDSACFQFDKAYNA